MLHHFRKVTCLGLNSHKCLIAWLRKYWFRECNPCLDYINLTQLISGVTVRGNQGVASLDSDRSSGCKFWLECPLLDWWLSSICLTLSKNDGGIEHFQHSSRSHNSAEDFSRDEGGVRKINKRTLWDALMSFINISFVFRL